MIAFDVWCDDELCSTNGVRDFSKRFAIASRSTSCDLFVRVAIPPSRCRVEAITSSMRRFGWCTAGRAALRSARTDAFGHVDIRLAEPICIRDDSRHDEPALQIKGERVAAAIFESREMLEWIRIKLDPCERS